MAPILSELDRIKFGPTYCTTQAERLDTIARTVLRRQVGVRAVVAPVGEWGRRECGPQCRPVAWVGGHPQHLVLLMDELRYALPGLQFVGYERTLSHSVALHDARVLWGLLPLPPAPVGDDVASRWAASVLPRWTQGRRCHAVEVWQLGRTVLGLAGLPVPALLDLPQRLQDAYTARNIGQAAPGGLHAELVGLVVPAVAALADGAPVADVAGPLRGRLLA